MCDHDVSSVTMGKFPLWVPPLDYISQLNFPASLAAKHRDPGFSNMCTKQQHFSTQEITYGGGHEQNSSLGMHGGSTSLDLHNRDHFLDPVL